jgi:hypothetical protein
MNQLRTAELTESLARLLAEATAEQRLGDGGRLAWLGHQLRIYSQRLVGFAAAPNMNREALRDSDLFRCVEVGAIAVEAEMAAMPSLSLRSAQWERVITAIDKFRQNGTAERAARIADAVKMWQDELTAA